MEKSGDWLPKNHEALYDQSNLTYPYLEGKFGDFGFAGKSAEVINTDIKPKYYTFKTAFETWRNPATRTPAMTADLQDAEKAFKPAHRELYVGFLKNNPLVTDSDLEKMGFPKRSSGGRTPIPVPATYPDISIEPDGIRRLALHFRDHGKKSTAKPHGVAGAVIRYAILPTPPVVIEELINTVLDTRTPYIFAFDENMRGQTLYACAAWQNTKGEKGAWSEIVNSIIP